MVEGEPYAGYDRHNAEVAAFHLDRYVPSWRAMFVCCLLKISWRELVASF